MSNRVITFNPTTSRSTSDREVYSDVSMNSSYMTTAHVTENEYQYLGFLIAEYKYDEAISYINSQDSSAELKKRFTVVFNGVEYAKKIAELNEWYEKSRYKVERNVNVHAVFDSLHNIFSWIPGERILDPEFGSNVRTYLYEGITNENKEQIASEIKRTVGKWEPRVNITRIVDQSTVEDHENNTVSLAIIFTIPSLSHEEYQYSLDFTNNSN